MEGDGQEVVEVVDVLEGYGLVAPKVAIDNLNALRIGTLAKHHASRVARQDVEKEEDKCHYSQQDKESVEKSFKGVAEHYLNVLIR